MWEWSVCYTVLCRDKDPGFLGFFWGFLLLFIILLIQQYIRCKRIHYSCDPPRKCPPKTWSVTKNMDINLTCVRKCMLSVTYTASTLFIIIWGSSSLYSTVLQHVPEPCSEPPVSCIHLPAQKLDSRLTTPTVTSRPLHWPSASCRETCRHR